jgi:hypothetical protein
MTDEGVRHDVEPEWPTREQMERVQALAADGTSLAISRVKDSETMCVKTDGEYGPQRFFDVDGDEVTDALSVPTYVSVKLPVDVVESIIGSASLGAALTAERGAHGWTDSAPYGLGHLLNDEIVEMLRGVIARVGDLAKASTS